MFKAEINLRTKTLNRLVEFDACVEKLSRQLISTLQNGNKIFWIGNGGSAGDAQHLSAELVGRFLKERKALASIALTTDTSALTSIANDYSFDVVFSRQLEGLGQRGDALVALTTSGASKNILAALDTARKMQMKTILLSSERFEGPDVADTIVKVPSSVTAIIQECHMIIGHTICKYIDGAFYEE